MIWRSRALLLTPDAPLKGGSAQWRDQLSERVLCVRTTWVRTWARTVLLCSAGQCVRERRSDLRTTRRC